MAALDPPDPALVDYVKSRLEELGPSFADPEIIHEALTYHRDLWAKLYAIDTAAAARRSADTS